MSAIYPEALKAATDPTISYSSFIENFTTTQIRHDFLLEQGKLSKSVKITNNDGINNVTYRLHSPSDTLRTVPPNSEVTLDDWTSYLEINPNAVTGSGQLEADLVVSKEAYK